MPKQSVSSIANVLRSCCHDLLPTSGESGSQAKSQSDSKSKSKAGPGTTNADSFLNPNLITLQVSPGSSLSKIEKTASNLLQAVLVSVPSELLAASLRAEIDRTIILTADKDAMLASVLNPIPATKGRGAGASLMPFLVRSYSDQMEVEALVRPRMPVLMTAPELDAYTENEEDEEAEEMDTETFDAAPSASEFLKAPAVEAPKHEPTPAVSSVHKRTYAEESTLQSTGFAVASEKQPVQTKKARFETTVSANSAESPSGKVQPVAVTQVSTSSHEQPQFKTQVSAVSTTSQSAADPADDESGDELPTLNMDSDTDEDDDDDVAMEG
jgi:pre-rRNA-processing protein RIX1